MSSAAQVVSVSILQIPAGQVVAPTRESGVVGVVDIVGVYVDRPFRK